MKLSKWHFFNRETQYLVHVLSTTGIKPLPSKAAAIKLMKCLKNAKQVRAFLGFLGYYCKFIKDFAQIAKPLTALTHHDAKFDWTSGHHAAFNTLTSNLIEAPILHYPNASKCYIVYMDASDDACGAQLSQEHNGQKLPVAFLSHTFTDTQQKWSTPEKEDYGNYCAVTKWNYYLQASDTVVHNDHKPLQKLLNSKHANNKVNRWSLELATYNSTFEWISGAHNKAADCLSGLVDVKDAPVTSNTPINMVVTSTPDGPATHTHSKTLTPTDTTPLADVKSMSTSNTDTVNAPPPVMEDCQDTL